MTSSYSDAFVIIISVSDAVVEKHFLVGAFKSEALFLFGRLQRLFPSAFPLPWGFADVLI
jgi:hypothetical protein